MLTGKERAVQAAFRGELGPMPVCAPGDVHQAGVYWRRVVRLLERRWSHSDTVQLRRLERKWRERMQGKDARFMVAGTRAGRLTRPVEQTLRQRWRER
jgi:hypothetical protein